MHVSGNCSDSAAAFYRETSLRPQDLVTEGLSINSNNLIVDSDGKNALNVEVLYGELDITTVDTPSNIQFDSDNPMKGTWDAVENATKYQVTLKKGTTIVAVKDTTNTYYDFTELIKEHGTGEYQFFVKSVNGETISEEAESSNTYTYSVIPNNSPNHSLAWLWITLGVVGGLGVVCGVVYFFHKKSTKTTNEK